MDQHLNFLKHSELWKFPCYYNAHLLSHLSILSHIAADQLLTPVSVNYNFLSIIANNKSDQKWMEEMITNVEMTTEHNGNIVQPVIIQ